jgi:hypothetical protein
LEIQKELALMNKIRVFVSSSLNELESEREIAQNTIEQLDMEPVMFEEFPAMDKPLENAYLDEIKKSHIFVCILWKDLTQPVEREISAAFELGIPILLIVKMITYRESRTQRLESLLNGKETFDKRLQGVPFRKKFRTLKELSEELKAGLMNLVSNKFTEPALTTTSNEVTSKMALSLVQNAKKRLLLIVKTPQILLGLRPYDSEKKNHLEEGLYNAVSIWIDEMLIAEGREFLLLYSEEHTQKEIKIFNLQNTFEKNLRKYHEIKKKTCGRFEIAPIKEFPGRILIGDNSFGIQFRAPGDKVVCVFRQDPSVATDLFNVFHEYKSWPVEQCCVPKSTVRNCLQRTS